MSNELPPNDIYFCDYWPSCRPGCPKLDHSRRLVPDATSETSGATSSLPSSPPPPPPPPTHTHTQTKSMTVMAAKRWRNRIIDRQRLPPLCLKLYWHYYHLLRFLVMARGRPCGADEVFGAIWQRRPVRCPHSPSANVPEILFEKQQ